MLISFSSTRESIAVQKGRIPGNSIHIVQFHVAFTNSFLFSLLLLLLFLVLLFTYTSQLLHDSLLCPLLILPPPPSSYTPPLPHFLIISPFSSSKRLHSLCPTYILLLFSFAKLLYTFPPPSSFLVPSPLPTSLSSSSSLLSPTTSSACYFVFVRAIGCKLCLYWVYK